MCPHNRPSGLGSATVMVAALSLFSTFVIAKVAALGVAAASTRATYSTLAATVLGATDYTADCTLTFQPPVALQAGGVPINIGSHAAPRFVDWTGAGHLDLLVGGGDGYVWLFLNTGTPTAPQFAAGVKVQDGASDLRAGTGYTGVCFVDMTGDGLKDLVVAYSDNQVRLYRNQGTATAPVFNGWETLPGPGDLPVQFQANCGARIDVADWDGDGLPDLLVGGFDGYIYWYRNTGTASQPSFTSAPKTFSVNGTTICHPYNVQPRAFDFNGDGVLDLIYGDNWGKVEIQPNTIGPGTLNFTENLQATLSNGQVFSNTLRAIAGDDSTPDFADLNGDGTLDLISGGANGEIWIMYGVSYTSLLDQIEAIMAAHTTDLGPTLASDSTLRTQLFGLHRSVRTLVQSLQPSAAMRDAIRDWYAGHIGRYPQYLMRQYLDPSTQTWIPYLAGQVWVNLLESEPDSAAQRLFVADATGAAGYYRDILLRFGMLFIEDNRADTTQQQVIDNLLATLPPAIWNVECTTIDDFLGSNPPSEVAIQSQTGANIFSNRVGTSLEGEFPADSVQQPLVDVFTIADAHEMNHQVDRVVSGGSFAWLQRKYALIQQACPADITFLPNAAAQSEAGLGVDWTTTQSHFQSAGFWDGNSADWNAAWSAYWSSGPGANYQSHWLRNNLDLMCGAPQEAFATLANQYFSNSPVMFDLCLSRWNRGITSCINQFLWFADTYSYGRNQTQFYTIDTQGNITCWNAGLQRNAGGYINQIQMPEGTYGFDLDANGFVTAIYTVPTGSVQVTILPPEAASAGAQWSVDGGTTWQISGATVSGIAVGSQTVSFKAVSGWTSPQSQTVTIILSGTATATGTYVQQTGGLQVTLTPAGAISAGAQWNVDGGAWQSSGATVSGLTVGSHAVNYIAIAGWNAPANASATIANNAMTTLTGTYVVQTGSLTVTLLPAAAVTAGAKWNVDGGAWQDSDVTVSGLLVGSHAVACCQLTGWALPPSQSVTINNNLTTAVTRTYVADLTPPAVTSLDPAADAWWASRWTPIALHITDAGAGVDASTVTIEASLDDSTWQTVSDGSALYDASNNAAFKGATCRAGTPADYTYVFLPAASFDFEQKIYIRVNASDLAQNAMSPYTYYFTTELRCFGCNVRADGGAARNSFPVAATDACGNVWVAWERSDASGKGTIYLAERENDHWNFDSEIQVTTSGDCHLPAITVVDDLGDEWVYLAYEVRDSVPASIGVVRAISPTAATTWTQLGPVSGASFGLQTGPAITVVANSTIYVAGVGPDGSSAQQVGVGTRDVISPATWTMTQITSGSNVQAVLSNPAIAQDANGVVYLGWANTGNNIDGADSSSAWAIQHVVQTGNALSPAMATEASGTVLHFVWQTVSVGGANTDILHAATTAGWTGVPLTGASALDTGGLGAPGAGAARIAVAGSGAAARVFVLWEDGRYAAQGSEATDILFAETKTDGTFGTNTLVSHVLGAPGVASPAVTNRGETIPALGVTEFGEPYAAWTDQPFIAGGESHIYFAEAMCPRFCGTQPLPVPISPAGGDTGNFTDPTNPHFTQVDVTVPANVFSTTRDIVVNELRNPVCECNGGSAIFADGSGLYLDITGGIDEVLPDWITVTVTLAPGATLPSPLAVYRLVPPATPTDSWTWTTDWIRIVSYNATTRVLIFQTKHLSSFGMGTSAPAASGGGGGGGGCAMSPGGETDVLVPLLPLVALGFWAATRRVRKGRLSKD